MALVLNFTTIIYLQKKNYDERMNTKNKRGHTKGIQSKQKKGEKKQTNKNTSKAAYSHEKIYKNYVKQRREKCTQTAFLHSTSLSYPEKLDTKVTYFRNSPNTDFQKNFLSTFEF